jgi:precorrin-2 dehydrogenase / sirohydrochlorin ferrochelatase
MNASYPVMMDLTGKSVLVVGAGPVATQKARGLVGQGALVTVVSPEVSDGMRQLGVSEILQRAYESSDLDGRWLVFAATGDAVVNQRVFDEATTRRLWVNCADEPDRCAFILTAVHRDGPITVSVSTGGASPALAGWLRDRIASLLPTGLAAVATELRHQRDALHASGQTTEGRSWRPIIEQLVNDPPTPETDPPTPVTGADGQSPVT